MSGIDLLQEFHERRSESAFSELILRYTNLVFSVALRRLGNQALAQDACQTVFIRLASKPPTLQSEAELAGWLHRTTLHVSIDLWRSELRRRVREEHAAAMHLDSEQPADWTEIAPALDEALNELKEPDRHALLLRYFRQHSMRELATALGVSEDAAKMRVGRALERLRDQLGHKGVTCPALALAGFLAERAVDAAPVAVAAAIASAAYPIGSETAAASGPGAWLAGISLAKVATVLTGLLLVGAGGWFLASRPREIRSVPSQAAPSVPASSTVAAAATVPSNTATPGQAALPDASKLLQGVARARQRLVSGTIAFEVETFSGTFQSTNRLRITAVFDGHKQRFEQVGREYSYLYAPEHDRQEEIKRKADAYTFDKEGAVRAGLLQPFESHSVTMYDGATLFRYRESDGKPQSTTLEDPALGSSTFVFDPRTLGIDPSPSPESTLERALALDAAASAQLLGMEEVEGTPAWHVRVPPNRLDLWLDAAHPERVLKVQNGGSVVISKYDAADALGALPAEVLRTDSSNGAITFQTRFVRTATDLNSAIDPSTFTLAGLGMKTGTDVVDTRLHRRLGYWTGTGLSETPPRKAQQESGRLEDCVAVLDTLDPSSPDVFDAARWILLNSPDGPEVEKAAAVLLREHVRSPEMLGICQAMDRMRHRCAVELLETVLKENPHPDVRAMACFTLATLRKDACEYGRDKKLAAEADALFQRVVTDFSKAGPTGADLAFKAATELRELRRMSLGQPAPALEGTNLLGRAVNLSQLRGKVTVVLFFDDPITVDGPEQHFRLLSEFGSKPVAWVGVYCGRDIRKALVRVEKEQLPWPILLDGLHGPLADDWCVRSWPSVFVLDGQGVIRARNERGPALVEAIKKLLAP